MFTIITALDIPRQCSPLLLHQDRLNAEVATLKGERDALTAQKTALETKNEELEEEVRYKTRALEGFLETISTLSPTVTQLSDFFQHCCGDDGGKGGGGDA